MASRLGRPRRSSPSVHLVSVLPRERARRQPPTRRSPSCSARFRCSCCSSRARTSRTCSSRAGSRVSARSPCGSPSESIGRRLVRQLVSRDGAAGARRRHRGDPRDGVGRWRRPSRHPHVRLAAATRRRPATGRLHGGRRGAGGDCSAGCFPRCSRVVRDLATRCARARRAGGPARSRTRTVFSSRRRHSPSCFSSAPCCSCAVCSRVQSLPLGLEPDRVLGRQGAHVGHAYHRLETSMRCTTACATRRERRPGVESAAARCRAPVLDVVGGAREGSRSRFAAAHARTADRTSTP